MHPDDFRELSKWLSLFALTWRRQMVAKKKWNYLEILINDSLWTEIESIAANVGNKRIAEMTKDLCLIAAALATDKIVISLDQGETHLIFFDKIPF